MSALNAVAALVAFATLAYLVHTLLRPERF
ncbi:MAG TPA: potassium-transporting ATPase subunit F [Gemmatimonadales bacterium]|jgi:K+-transporting ATPase KdpF subunit